MPKIIDLAIQSTFFLCLLSTSASAISLKPIGTFSSGIFDDGAAEISAFDPNTNRLFITNGSSNTIDILDISNPTMPRLDTGVSSIDLNPFGSGVNSVTVANGTIAVALEHEMETSFGSIAFFDTDGRFRKSVEVGALPDSLIFTPDGSKLLVTNEGEPSDNYDVDPFGSVSIIDILNDFALTTAGFESFTQSELESNNVRLFIDSLAEEGIETTIAQDLEPENITVSDDGGTAYVTLQENNAIAILNLDSQKGDIGFTDIVGLGFKNHGEEGNGLDASDRDGGTNIQFWENLFGMYQPDGVDSYTVGGKTFLVTANEGSFRRTDVFDETIRVGDLFDENGNSLLDLDIFSEDIQADEALGRLQVSRVNGDRDGDGLFEELFTFGGRSFSIWEVSDNGLQLVFDSGDDFEMITAAAFPDNFNADNDDNRPDRRSDNRGPEPSSITLSKIGDRTYAFTTLQRIGGIMIYDVTDPSNPSFVDYVNNRDFSEDPETGNPLDLGPEGLLFIEAHNSPNQNPLVVVTNEVSGTTTIYSATQVPESSSIWGLLAFISFGCFGLKFNSRQ